MINEEMKSKPYSWAKIYIKAFFDFLFKHKANDALFPEIRMGPLRHMRGLISEYDVYSSDATKVEMISNHLYDWLETPEKIESTTKTGTT